MIPPSLRRDKVSVFQANNSRTNLAEPRAQFRKGDSVVLVREGVSQEAEVVEARWQTKTSRWEYRLKLLDKDVKDDRWIGESEVAWS